MTQPYISVVIPVHNERESLKPLCERLLASLQTLHKPFEIIFTNDGSTDDSGEILDALYKQHPGLIRVIHFNTNYGQHMAMMAAFEKVRGEVIVTMDADLQNLPEDIPKVIAKLEEGYDVVGGYRENRQDDTWRKWVSKAHNYIRSKLLPNMPMKDQGCMLRAYRRYIVDLMAAGKETTTYIPALALSYAQKSTDIPVRHSARVAGTSKYNLYNLIRANFDLVTNFSLVPLQLFTLLGISVSGLSGLLVIYLFIRRIVVGSEAHGMFTLFAIAFFLISLCLLGLGILGEYLGRIYQEVRKRPRFVIHRISE